MTTPFVDGHPRPTLTRPSWTDLCGTWSFAYDDEDTGLVDRWQRASRRLRPHHRGPVPTRVRAQRHR